MAEKAYGLLINYEFCTGCGTCEMACSVEHDIPIGRYGIQMATIGPWQIDKKNWQLDTVPSPTDECDLCAKRVEKGKKPTCVKHCQSLCMEYGPVDELAAKLAGRSLPKPPATTALGALLNHLSTPAKHFQPSNVHFGLMPEPEIRVKKKERKQWYADRARAAFGEWLKGLEKEGD